MNQQSIYADRLKRQIQPWRVHDPHILDWMNKVSRHFFVSNAYQAFAYSDVRLALANHQTMLTPKEEAKVLQALNIQPTDNVLEIGSGSGYLTALLAKQVPHVCSVDIDPQVTQQVAKKLALLNIDNVTMVSGNAIQGWHAQSNYDIILINGSVPFVPKKLCEQLAMDGRLFAVTGESPNMQATLVTRQGPSMTDWKVELIFETDLPRIANPLPQETFRF